MRNTNRYPSQWDSSDQARCVTSLVANGVIQVPTNRDVMPDQEVLFCRRASFVTVFVPQPVAHLVALRVLRQIGCRPTSDGVRIRYRET